MWPPGYDKIFGVATTHMIDFVIRVHPLPQRTKNMLVVESYCELYNSFQLIIDSLSKTEGLSF